MPYRSAFLNSVSIGMVRIIGNARYRRVSYNLIVLDWYFAEWLEATETTQAEVGRRTGYPKAKMSDLFNGKQRYNRDILNDIAAALNIAPHELLMHPADAMAQRRIRQLAEQMVQPSPGGIAVDLEEKEAATRKAG